MIRKATTADAKQIQKLIGSFADKGEMLPRSLNELYEHVRDYSVIELDNEIVACAALHVNWDDLGEVKSLAVSEDFQKRGFGRLLVDECKKEALVLGLSHLYTLTYQPEFFKKMGFTQVDKSHLPQKVWSECINCPKFPDCGEVALIYKL